MEIISKELQEKQKAYYLACKQAEQARIYCEYSRLPALVVAQVKAGTGKDPIW